MAAIREMENCGSSSDPDTDEGEKDEVKDPVETRCGSLREQIQTLRDDITKSRADSAALLASGLEAVKAWPKSVM